MADFLADPQASAELPGWIEYERLEDELQTNRLIYAITSALVKAFGGDKKQARAHDLDDEEVIDTTDPKFAQQFKGFINQPGQVQRMPQRHIGTQIIMG